MKMANVKNVNEAACTRTLRQPNVRLQSRNQGFSVVELIIVVALVGILVAIAIPSITRTLELSRLDTSASIVASKLSEARINAIKRNRTTWLEINPVSRTVQVRSTDGAGATVNLGFPATLPEGVIFSNSDNMQITITSLGRLSGASQTVTLRTARTAQSKSLTITPAGRVTVGAITQY